MKHTCQTTSLNFFLKYLLECDSILKFVLVLDEIFSENACEKLTPLLTSKSFAYSSCHLRSSGVIWRGSKPLMWESQGCMMTGN